MKKKAIAVVLGACCVATSLGSCGKVVENIDKDRTQIYVSVYNGGYGLDWIKEIKKQFEADYPEYQVIISGTMDDDLFAGASSLNYNVYFTTSCYSAKTLFARDLFMDLSDIYEKPVFNETVKIKDKVQDYELLTEAFAFPGKTGLYALPFTKSFGGFVYDHDIFKKNINKGWLIPAAVSDKSAAEAQGLTVEEKNGNLYFKSSTGKTNYVDGDVLLRAGKDGKFGTYDDGQPITMEEWNTMLACIKIDSSRKAKPITFSDTHGYHYTLPILEGVFAQYEGLENVKTFYKKEGTYTRGEQTATITPEKGYEAFEMEGLEKAMEFYYDNICSSDNTVIAKGSDHLGAQNKFLLYNQIDKNDYAAAMLVEGIWWENEARTVFDSLADNDKSYKYGSRDYRYMLLPEMEGQKGIDGEGNGSVFAAQDMGVTMVAKKGSEDVRKMSKKFVEYTLKDENLQRFTEITGVARPYTYSMSDVQLGNMTKFQRTTFEIMQDTENVIVTAPLWYNYCSPIGALTSLSSFAFRSRIAESAGTAVYDYPINLRNRVKDVDTYMAGMKKYYKEEWSSLYDSVKELYK